MRRGALPYNRKSDAVEPSEAAEKWFEWLGEGRLLWTEPDSKKPSPKLGKWSEKVPYTKDDIPQIFGKAPADCGYWLALPDWLIMVGPDNQAAIDLLSARLSNYNHTALEHTPHGEHAYFSGGPLSNPTSLTEGDAVWDIRSVGGGAKCWPSEGYELIRDLTHVRGLPKDERVAGCLYPTGSGGGQGQATGGSGAGKRTPLDALLDAPPAGADSGRNDWLIRVCGFLAKNFRNFRRDYEHFAWMAVEKLDRTDFPDDEVQNTIDSAWNTEQKKGIVGEFKEDSGFVVGDGRYLYTQVKDKDGNNQTMQWANFDMTARGIIYDEEGKKTYDLMLHTDKSVVVVIPAPKFGSWRSLSPILAGYGATVGHSEIGSKKPAKEVRLQRYVEAQHPPVHYTTPSLGWLDKVGFIVHEGVIDKDGLHRHDLIVPAPRLKNWADFKYGFDGEEESQDVLRTILTFHDETVCAVFASYCLACILKEHIRDKIALWPFLVLEAPSGSGKTTGFFPLMLSLMGYDSRPGVFTGASFRDTLTTHRNAPAWIDDPSSLKGIWELLRQATGGGSSTKKGEDNAEQIKAVLVNPVVLSGEGFPELQREKALADRALKCAVPDPQERKSLLDPTKYQWVDISAFRAKHHDKLNNYAGNIVQLVLSQTQVVDEFEEYRTLPGRVGDKIAVIRMGAELLCLLTGDPKWRTIIDDWAAMQNTEHDDFLIQRILPYFIQSYGLMNKPNLMNPVYVDKKGIVWFNVEMVAHMWENARRDSRELQLGSLEAIRRQMTNAGIKGSTAKPIYNTVDGGVIKKLRYQRLSQLQSERVVTAAGYVVGETDEVLQDVPDFAV